VHQGQRRSSDREDRARVIHASKSAADLTRQQAAKDGFGAQARNTREIAIALDLAGGRKLAAPSEAQIGERKEDLSPMNKAMEL
jgi:hypothetical protein